MDIRCIALDLDKTTLDKEGKLSEGNKKALLEAIDKGIEVIVASGRGLTTLPQEIAEFPGINYVVTCNGAGMYHLPTGKCMMEYNIDGDSVDRIMAATADEHTAYEAFIHGKAYTGQEYWDDPEAYGVDSQIAAYVRATRTPVGNIKEFIKEHRCEISSLVLIASSLEMNERMTEKVRTASDSVYITTSFVQFVEVSDKRCGKANGVKFFLDELGIKPENLAAFGDAHNDIDMIVMAGAGIAVDNASEDCKASADYITRSHDDDGVAFALRNILKII